MCGHLLGEAGLADSWLPGHQERPALAGQQARQTRGCDLKLPGPAHEGLRRESGPGLARHSPILRRAGAPRK